jgi:hypothetical protein
MTAESPSEFTVLTEKFLLMMALKLKHTIKKCACRTTEGHYGPWNSKEYSLRVCPEV